MLCFSYLIYFPHFPLEPECFESIMTWTWLPSVTLFTFELPVLPRCTHTNIHCSLRRPPAVNGKRWSVWFACLPRQVMGHIPQDPEESVWLAHPPLTPPLKGGEFNCVCVCGHLYACVCVCVCVCVQKCFHTHAFYYQLCVRTHEWFVCSLEVREVNLRLPTQDIVSQFNHGSTSWWSAADW